MPKRSDRMRQHTIMVLVENRDSVLARITSLFSSRGYSIDSISLGKTLDPMLARMTVVTRGDDVAIERLTKHLHKLIEVIKVVDVTDLEHVSREMTLLRIAPEANDRAEVFRIAEVFRARIVDVAPNAYTIEATGDSSKLDAFVELLRPYGLQELVRTGTIAIGRARAPAAKRDPHRKHPRHSAPFEVRVEAADGDACVFAHDISEGGMRIETPRDIDVGAALRLRIVHPRTGERLELAAVVRRKITDDERRGVAVEFVELDADGRAKLAELIRSGTLDEQPFELLEREGT